MFDWFIFILQHFEPSGLFHAKNRMISNWVKNFWSTELCLKSQVVFEEIQLFYESRQFWENWVVSENSRVFESASTF